MKKTVIALLALLMLLGGCGGQPAQTVQEPETPPPLQNGQAWVKYFNSWLPVSAVEGGEQLLQPLPYDAADVPWYFEIYPKLGLPDDFPCHNLPDTLTGGGIPEWHYHDISEMFGVESANPVGLTEEGWLTSYTWSENSLFDGLALSGDWQPFTTPVRFVAYSPDDQPADIPCRDELAAIMQEKAAAVKANEGIDEVAIPPLLAKCAYYFDADGDGREECLLNLGNLAGFKADSPNPPAEENSLIYSLTVYISGSGELTVMDEGGASILPAKPLIMDENNPDNDIYYSYLPPEENDPTKLWYEQWYAAYFADASGKPAPSPIYNCGEFNNAPELHMLLADIDGDGRAELITCSASIYYPLTVYKFDGDKLQYQFAVVTPA